MSSNLHGAFNLSDNCWTTLQSGWTMYLCLSEAWGSRIVLDVQQLYRSQPALLDLEEDWTANGSTPGGVIYSLEPLDVARFLAHSFHLLIEVLVERDIPIHLLAFPRFCTDLDYLLRVLAPVLPGGIDQATLKERIAPVINLDKIRMAKEMGETRGSANGIVEAGCPDLSSLHGVSLKREVKRLLVELARTQAELSERNCDVDQLRCQIDSIHASFCWRLTWPIRRLHKLDRRVRNAR
jgi:hypothetical protein